MSPYLQMARNNADANARLYTALVPLPYAIWTAPRPGFFPSLAATMTHILQLDLYYLDALQSRGQGRTVFDAPQPSRAHDLAQAQAGADARLVAVCKGNRSTETITDRPGGPITEQTDALLLHLFQHQIHHRGQAHAQLSHAGIAPPQLDEFHLAYDRHPKAQTLTDP